MGKVFAWQWSCGVWVQRMGGHYSGFRALLNQRPRDVS
jgi:hypothetical protein